MLSTKGKSPGDDGFAELKKSLRRFLKLSEEEAQGVISMAQLILPKVRRDLLPRVIKLLAEHKKRHGKKK
jgi:hypothetical protein